MKRAGPSLCQYQECELFANLGNNEHEPQPLGESMDLIRILIAILVPPLGVFLQEGLGKHFWINIILTLLGYIPGIVHAVYIIAKK
ncbi:YqaE/Pmp3 family membrane protein [Limnobacter sp.]|uniref:YqaE/Pmp3 family membrane protein n=1 Tax=Limnobacter sp. TaxID=2003368 RepID=UPI002FE22FF7